MGRVAKQCGGAAESETFRMKQKGTLSTLGYNSAPVAAPPCVPQAGPHPALRATFSRAKRRGRRLQLIIIYSFTVFKILCFNLLTPHHTAATTSGIAIKLHSLTSIPGA